MQGLGDKGVQAMGASQAKSSLHQEHALYAKE